MVKMQGAEDEGAGSVLKYMTKPDTPSHPHTPSAASCQCFLTNTSPAVSLPPSPEAMTSR